MELSLQTFFDLGISYGLGDDVFRDRGSLRASEGNPFGCGLALDLKDCGPHLLSQWRDAAARKVYEEDMEIGYEAGPSSGHGGVASTKTAFRTRLVDLITTHPIQNCHLTIYAIGVAYLRLDLASGIPADCLFGVAHCFEYAAYENDVSTLLLDFAKDKTRKAVEQPRKRLFRDASGLSDMSKRPAPEVTTRTTRVGDVQRDVVESALFLPQGITHVVMCVDEGDADVLEDVKSRMKPSAPSGSSSESSYPQSESSPSSSELSASSSGYTPLQFEYHGTLYFDWAVCVIVPRSFQKLEEATREQIAHILSCMQVAQSFQGVCQICDTLVSTEIRSETAGYIKGDVVGRDPVYMNRLRTLALTIVNLADYMSVTEAEEDLKFFERFDRHARLSYRRANIRAQVGELFGTVLDARRVAQDERLNIIIVSLTSLTALSVFVDGHEFLSDSGPLLPAMGERWLVFGLAVAAVVCIAAVVVRFIFGEGKGS